MVGFVEYTFSFRYPPKKKYSWVKSGEEGGHTMSSNLLISRFGNAASKITFVSLAVGMLPYFVETIYINLQKNHVLNKKKVKFSMARSLRVENLLPQNLGSIINYLQ